MRKEGEMKLLFCWFVSHCGQCIRGKAYKIGLSTKEPSQGSKNSEEGGSRVSVTEVTPEIQLYHTGRGNSRFTMEIKALIMAQYREQG